jgi:hypothetical protein
MVSRELQYRYGLESGNAFLINSRRGLASSAMMTSTTSNRKRMSGLSSIRSQASAPREIRSFVAIHGFYRAAEIFAAARLYFNKHQCVIVTTDNINLTAAATAEIAEQDLVSVTFEVAAR